MTEAASWLGAGLGVQGAQQEQAWALGRTGQAAAGTRGLRGGARAGAAGSWASGRSGRAGVRSRWARRALGARACWESGRRRCRRASRVLGVSALGVSARGARLGRACAHGGHAG